MASSFMPEAQKEIRRIIQDINDAWVKGEPENLAKFFHENMVIVAPSFQARLEDKDACVKSYQDFCSQSTVHDFKETGHAVDAFGSTVVATYSFDITYEMKGEIYHETGSDVFVFVREGDRWLAVWRTLIPFTEEKQRS